MCDKNQKFDHQYAAGICLVCGRSQRPVHTVEPMPNLFKDLCNRKKESDNPKIQLSQDCIKLMGGTYGKYMAIINRCGEQNVRCWLSDSKESKNPVARFLYLYKQFNLSIKWN